MPDTSPRLTLPYLMPSQAQKHVTHNEALQRLDSLVQLVVQAIDAQTPPALPSDGEIHALGPAPTDAWAGQAGALAIWSGTSWQFITPLEGWQAWDQGSASLRIHVDGAWIMPPADTDNLTGLGIQTTPDPTNRLAVVSPATLFSHDGAGHQIKVNKAGTTDTGSLLFQTGWSGRAEMGLSGSDDFSVKVSADGTTWHTGLSVAGADGKTTFDKNVQIEGNLHCNGAINILTTDSNPTSSNVDGLSIQPGGQIRASNSGTAVMVVNRSDGSGAIISCKASGVYAGGLRVDPGEMGLTTPDALTFSAGNNEAMRIDPQGQVGIGLSPGAPLHVRDLMRLEPSAPPATPSMGDIYFDATTLKLRCHDGTIWHDLF